MVTTLMLLVLMGSLGTLLYFQVQNVSHNFPQWLDWVEKSFHNYFISLKEQINEVPDTVTDNVKGHIDSLGEKIGNWVYIMMTTLFANVSSITEIITKAVLGYILSIFLAFEWPKLQTTAARTIPESIKKFSVSVFGDTVKGIGSFIKAQLILIFCAFGIVWISLSVVGIKNALLIAVISGILDVMPLLGISTLFVPWLSYLYLTGQTGIAIKLTILYVILLAFRHIMEPRITGDSLGISPFIMLAGMLISVSVLGVVGIILAPVILVIIKSLWTKGYFRIWLCKGTREEGTL